MSPKLTICLIIPSLQAGGMERVMSELMLYFSKKNTTIHLVLYGRKRDVFYNIPDSTILHRPTFRFNNNSRLLSTIRTFFYIRKTNKQINPDTILSFGEVWNNMVLFSLYGLKFPIYVSDRSQPDKSLGRTHDFLRRLLYPTAKGIILQSEKAKINFLDNISNRNDNIKVIGNPIRKIELNNNIHRGKNILMVGRLIRSKHQDRLIKIFASINNPDWKLILVGYDHLKQRNMQPLKTLAKNLEVSDRIIFTGKQSDVESYYLECSIFAFTSSSEGFPNAIGEAMSAGVPVVTYDCVAGPSEMVQDSYNGFLIPVFDDVLFRAKIIELMENESLRKKMGDNARKSIKRFDVKNIGEEFFQFIINNE